MPKVKPVKKTSQEELIALSGISYVEKKNQIKTLESECKEYRKDLEPYLDSVGTTLANGSRLAIIPHADLEVHLKKTLRVSKVLLPEAMDVLKANGLEECIENVPTIREDVLESLINSGKVPPTLLKSIYASKDTFAFSVELKNRMSDEPE